MGKLYVIMGKSATGKDTVLAALLTRISELREVVEYTTRPRRRGERDGVDYFFVSEERLAKLQQEGKVIECRRFDTIHGPWYYFNVDDGQFDFQAGNRILVTTLAAYCKIQQYFGAEQVVPLYLEVSDRTRLHRAVEREDKQDIPRYAELCRRFLADNDDFSEESLASIGMTERYCNENLEECLDALMQKIGGGTYGY